MRTTTRRTAQGAVALGCALAPLLAAAPASADVTGTTAQSWYWAEKAGVGPAPVGAPDQASGVPEGDLGVSYTTDVDKVTALGLDTGGAPTGSRFTRYRLTLTLDPDAQQLANGTPQVVACRSLDPVRDGALPGPLTEAPSVDTVVCADGAFDAKTTSYTFDLRALADDWASGTAATGVVVLPKPGDTTPFSYAFRGGSGVKVDAALAPAAAAQPTAAPAAQPAAPAAAAGPSGNGTGSGGTGDAALSDGFGAGTVQPPADTAGDLPDAGAPAVAAPPALPGEVPAAAPAAPAPDVAVGPVQEAPASGPAVPALAARDLSDLAPSAAVWLGGLVLAALLAAVSLVLGDPLAPLPLDTRRRRFADVVRSRARATAPRRTAPGTLRTT